jgi:superfamily II DNA or RNA helicase
MQDEKTLEFLQKLKDSGNWNDNYDYSKVEYINNISEVIVINKRFNTEHLVLPKNLLRGIKLVGRNLVNGYISFEEARDFVRNLSFENENDYRFWSKNNRPPNIPSHPQKVYKDKGWVSWGDWYGTNTISTNNRIYLPFNEAKKLVRSFNLKNQKEWYAWSKSDKRPDNIPGNPNKIYKTEFISLGDFVGYRDGWGDFLPYNEAIKIVHTLKIANKTEWNEFCKEGKTPINIPSNPNKKYKDNGWNGWGDWLGTFNVATFDRKYWDFNTSKEFVKTLNLTKQQEWFNYCKSYEKPYNLPSSPHFVYKKEWISWSDWLGYIGDGTHKWTKHALISFIKSLENELINLDSVELITIINSNNIAKKIREIGSLEDLISSQGGSEERRRLVHNIVDRIDGQEDIDVVEDIVISEFENELVEGISIDVTEEQEELAPLDPIQELHMYDNNMITASLDDENLDFLMKNQLKKLWNRVLNNEISLDKFRSESGNENFSIIKNWFFDEYEKVIQIESPSDYMFKYEPNLMQKLITYRLINEKRYGNWSGTGAGKTLSAIFAGRYAGAKNTLIVCNNATVEGWTNSIHEYFNNSNVYTKKFLDYTDSSLYSIVDKYDVNFVDGENNYLILNYETFQLEDGEYIVSELLKNNVIDYIILDEVQNVKQRDDDESTRRNVVSKLIIHSKEKNEDLLVMAMSATPVINNLTEPKKLIELLTGELHDELNTNENIINGIEMYKALTRHGLRYKPNYGITVNEELIEIDGSHLSEEIIKIPRGAVVDFEKVLIQTKLDGIKDKIKKGTLIYTHYVTELSHLIGDYVKDLGFSIGYYTGEDKSGLRPFKEGKIDVLIGSAPVGTGVDGIQYVCNTLIPIVLPWTSSEYDQLKGRIDRQGSFFNHVNIYIPQVVISTGDNIWSWDKRRHNIIRFKATLADLAVDGRVPKNLLPSRAKLVEDAKKELSDWINRLQDGDMITFEREELMIPLNPIQIQRSRNQLGDFSDMNQRWSVSRSDNTHERLVKDPSEWYYYHTLYSEKRKTWSEIPFVEIAKKINVRPDWVVGDFGCGENLLSKEIKNKVYAFDHVAIDDSVYACDIKNVPIEDGILDVAVFSLSLMGSNYSEYFTEAYRTLKVYGNIFVCEPAAKWEGRENELKNQIESSGFKCFGAVRNTDKFIYIDGVKY